MKEVSNEVVRGFEFLKVIWIKISVCPSFTKNLLWEKINSDQLILLERLRSLVLSKPWFFLQ